MNKYILLTLLLVLSSKISMAQIAGFGDEKSNSLFTQDPIVSGQMDQLMQTDQVPVGNIVDADHYYIGPGDYLSIQISPLMIVPQIVSVSPSNAILVPRFGTVELGKKTITEARDTLIQIYKKINPNFRVSLVLQKARLCLIKVEGNIKNPGTYSIPASYKISTVLKYLDNFDMNNQISALRTEAILRYEEQINEKAKQYSESGLAESSMYVRRNIKVLHSDGKSTNADLEKAKYMESEIYDPYVKEGDVIYVPFNKFDFPFISISGEVVRPVKIGFKSGDKLELLLKASYGITEEADLNSIYYFNANNEKTKIEVSLDFELLSENFELEPGGRVIVGKKKLAKSSEKGVVSIKGNVKKPGVYEIEEGKTKVKDVIAKAGGFTEKAYLPLANIYRQNKFELSTNNPEKLSDELFQYSDLKLLDTIRWKMDIRYMKPKVSIDFVELYYQDNEQENAYLKDGDIIEVPSAPREIYVFGQVNSPGYIGYEENKNIEWYIDRAGGYGQHADVVRTRIIRGKNSVWLETRQGAWYNKTDTQILDGDMIYVPHEIDLPPDLQTQRYGAIAGIVGAFASLINLVIFIIINTRNN